MVIWERAEGQIALMLRAIEAIVGVVRAVVERWFVRVEKDLPVGIDIMKSDGTRTNGGQ